MRPVRIRFVGAHLEPTLEEMVAFKHILVPTDFSDAANAATDLAVELSKTYGADLTLLHAFEIPVQTYQGVPPVPVDYWTPVRDAAARRLEIAVDELRKKSPNAKGVLAHGAPWEEILSTAKDVGTDLIVMGTHGRRGVMHALLGSVAEKVIRLSPIPVLTVRASAAAHT